MSGSVTDSTKSIMRTPALDASESHTYELRIILKESIRWLSYSSNERRFKWKIWVSIPAGVLSKINMENLVVFQWMSADIISDIRRTTLTEKWRKFKKWRKGDDIQKVWEKSKKEMNKKEKMDGDCRETGKSQKGLVKCKGVGWNKRNIWKAEERW